MPMNITIEVDPDCLQSHGITTTGNFVITPALLRVNAGDVVEWSGSNPFVLDFKDGTPLEEGGVQLAGIKEGGDDPTLPVRFSTGRQKVAVTKGHFHYAVAVYKDGEVFIDAGCADLSVN